MNSMIELDNGWVVIDHSRFDSPGHSRGKTILTSIDTRHERYFIDDTEVIIIQLLNKKWLITCSYYVDEPLFADVGPFETFDDVVIHFRLVTRIEDR